MRTLLMLAVFGGCMMSGGSGDMLDSMRAAQEEEQVHVTESRSAVDLPAILSETDRHGGRMTVILDDMEAHMSSMGHCSNMSAMMGMHDNMQAEMDQHRAAMHAATDMTAARGEDEHHMTVMGGMLGTMDSQFGHMNCGGMW